jgi:hypothetical protein
VGVGEKVSGKGIWWKSDTSIQDEQMTILPVDHHSDHKIKPVVFILGEKVAKYYTFTSSSP